MSFEQLKTKLLESAKDIKLNLSTLLQEEGSDLTKKQLLGIALTSAYAIKNAELIEVMLAEACTSTLSEVEIDAAKAAATIMAMNNIYYRFIHLVNDNSFASMPARLRMNVIGNPGIEKIDFELFCLAVSAINGCGMCIEAHTRGLLKAGLSKLAIQSVIRIAAVLNAVAQGLYIAECH
ncbi:MAG: carboxymuconolactone decarboxylase family protein [Rickettsiella sp.]|nr:carboxymuconolactone decarboxylase family protein [Rickettsiella sp.]